MTTDPAVTAVFFSLAFLGVVAAGAAWQWLSEKRDELRAWREWDRQRREDRLAQRRTGAVSRVAAYTGTQKPVADTFPADWTATGETAS